MKRRILLIEDNETNRYLATYLLEAAGMQVIHAGNGRDGVEAATRERPDLVLMDIEMPEMDGYQAAALLKRAPETRGIPLVAATAYAMAGDREKAMAMGFAEYIEKPYDPDDFIKRIVRLLPPASP